ncbi:phage tail protein [Tumebacillus permanentifrigoris]|uniref:Microcystin-dependent protein n=1 Tax=Tumebacillus permanentifrigoris TaxID=378543 RepID=A0A316DA34_9BACL|nr:tail fiber protein [Tumebacillus permanentifrigoris]PWK13483.1 microcystin-dependent protein [Tumebacillus permanentifrigoris]
MAEAFIGEIRVFAGNFAPRDWAFCNGQLMSIAQNTALFSLLGTQYGGDGRTTFALPNLSGRAAMSQGQGPGLTERTVGEQVGSGTVTLLTTEIPAHTHIPQAVAAKGTATDPTNTVWAETPPQGRTGTQIPLYAATPNVTMSPLALSVAGGSQPHNNMQPFLAMNFIICLYGIFPSRQ